MSLQAVLAGKAGKKFMKHDVVVVVIFLFLITQK